MFSEEWDTAMLEARRWFSDRELAEFKRIWNEIKKEKIKLIDWSVLPDNPTLGSFIECLEKLG